MNCVIIVTKVQVVKKKRPPVNADELKSARSRLGSRTEPRTATARAMEECEKIGVAAPSVFSSLRTGKETAFQDPQDSVTS
uniref:Musculoskeletal embryonic nuclear protein 1 n=1 Tax=Eptatretus burgeri TaxID=7764 RepID=A0A8C4QV56_EPTBU